MRGKMRVHYPHLPADSSQRGGMKVYKYKHKVYPKKKNLLYKYNFSSAPSILLHIIYFQISTPFVATPLMASGATANSTANSTLDTSIKAPKANYVEVYLFEKEVCNVDSYLQYTIGPGSPVCIPVPLPRRGIITFRFYPPSLLLSDSLILLFPDSKSLDLDRGE
ncbi:unnamed protein product [Periconia digitata]|uniref:Uncharacterized protein n=1 Tax=Periconia digitata TaxID=1303443 RepID=A0A9W4US09_9PLEO|nr:unnamed protein product [Periconia digitata]